MINFTKLFNDYKISFKKSKKGNWVNITCPHCEDKTFNGGFNSKGEYYHCWRCGGHPLNKTIALLLGIKENQIKELLTQYKGRNLLLYGLNEKKISKVSRLELPTDTFLPIERKYLKDRGFSPSYLHNKYKVVGGGLTGKWKFRIIIPLLLDGKIISWTGRSILEKSKLKELGIPRYKNLSIDESVFNPKEMIFNLDNAKGETVVLTEGPFDVLRFGDGAVCSFGTSITQTQIKVLKNRFKKIFILFDNEPEAQEKARKYGFELSSIGLDVEIVDAFGDFNKNDMGELTQEEVNKIRKELGLKLIY